MIFSLKFQGLLGDKGKSTRQVALKTIMNTRIQVILEILQIPLGWVRRFSKSGRVFIWKSRFFRLFYQEEEQQHQIKNVQEKK